MPQETPLFLSFLVCVTILLLWILSLLKQNQSLQKEVTDQRNLLLSKDLATYYGLTSVTDPASAAAAVPDYYSMSDEAEAERYEQLTGGELAQLMRDDAL